ncbi:MAG: hypothetical protein HY864_00910 [Chloroflexi bacterium]|nr:hypothetical protein [Chloroflexota bacterium]
MPEKMLDVLQNLLIEHQNKAYLSCDETCFCWSVQELIASVEEAAAQPLRAVDAASAPSAEANSSPVIVPAVEFDTQPRP